MAVSAMVSGLLAGVSATAAHATGTSVVLGDLSYQRYDTHALTDRSGVSVNVANGNLVMQSEDLHIGGTGPALSISRSFNEFGSGSGAVGGKGTLGVGPDVHITGNADGSATYQGPSGLVVVFAGNGSGGYLMSPSYTAATLAKITNGWTLTFNTSGEVYTFNSAGNQVKDASANGEAITYAYNANGTLATATDAEGRVTTFSNYSGNQVGSVTDSSGRHVSYRYTSGNLTGVTDAAGGIWQFQYYDGHSLNQITDPRGYTTVVNYDGSGRVASIVFDDFTSAATTWTYTYNTSNTVVTDPLGHATTYYYDSSGRVTNVLNAVGDYFGSSYDPNNNQTSSTDPSSQATTFTYGQLNNLTSVQNPSTAGGGAGALSSYSYGDAAHPYLASQSTDAQGNTVAYSYDTNGNLMSSTSASSGGTGMGSATRTIQGDNGVNCGAQPDEVCTSKDADGNVTSYGYDTKGQVTSVTPPGPVGAETIGYDSLSRPTSITDGNGHVTTVTYDGNDHPLVLTYSDGSSVQYSHDADGNLTQRVDAAGTTQWTYDGRNRITQLTQTGQPTLSYSYDGADNMVTESGPAGTTTYSYTRANEIGGVNQSVNGANETFVFEARRPAIVYLPGGIVENIGYDTAGRETSINALRTNADHSTTTLTNYTASYTTASGKDSGVVQSETNNVTGVTTNFGYDGLNRLGGVAATGSGANSYTYTYDNNGNRTQYSHNGSYSAIFGFNSANELTTSGGAADGSYDHAGNQTSTGAGLALGYNAKNQTTAFSPPGQATLSQGYTDGDQAGRTANGATTQENGLLGVYSDTTGGTSTYYTHLPTGTHQVLGETTGTSASYYLTDMQGSIVAVTDVSANVEDTYSYDPYGNTLASSGTTANPWRYAGGYYDTASGLYKFGERYYDPADGRWTQLDPSGQNPGYIYVGDNPVNDVDPTGECGIFSCVGNALSDVNSAVNDAGDAIFGNSCAADIGITGLAVGAGLAFSGLSAGASAVAGIGVGVAAAAAATQAC